MVLFDFNLRCLPFTHEALCKKASEGRSFPRKNYKITDGEFEKTLFAESHRSQERRSNIEIAICWCTRSYGCERGPHCQNNSHRTARYRRSTPHVNDHPLH